MIPVLDLRPEIEEIREEIDAAIQRVIDNTGFILGPEVAALEEEITAYLFKENQKGYAVGVNSGTDALVIALRALGIGQGDEVITSPFSFFASAESISILGARPVFVDIEADSFNIDPGKIERVLSPRTKAIMPVHLFGRPAAMGRIMEIAQEHHLKVVEDCAQSFGAVCTTASCDKKKGECRPAAREELQKQLTGTRQQRDTGRQSDIGRQSDTRQQRDTGRQSDIGKKTGTIGHAGAFSFFPSKNLGGFGDGGMVVTGDPEIMEKARMLRAHGSRKKYQNELPGYNSRLDSLQAAVLRVKLPHIDRWNEGRRRAAQIYNQLLADVPGVMVPRVTPGHVFHQYTIRLLDKNRDRMQTKLREKGIGSMVYYPVPQDQLPVYKGQYERFPVSDTLSGQVLSLPIWPSISQEIQEQVVTCLAD